MYLRTNSNLSLKAKVAKIEIVASLLVVINIPIVENCVFLCPQPERSTGDIE